MKSYHADFPGYCFRCNRHFNPQIGHTCRSRTFYSVGEVLRHKERQQ